MTIVVVMSCNGVEMNGKKVITTCFSKLADLESPLREELYLMAKCTEQLAPKISAAGFFTLNQATLMSIISFLTTYLIIIIQFNVA